MILLQFKQKHGFANSNQYTKNMVNFWLFDWI